MSLRLFDAHAVLLSRLRLVLGPLRGDFGGEGVHVHSGSGEVLAAVNDPLNEGNDKDNPECGHAVVLLCVSRVSSPSCSLPDGLDSLMLLPVTGRSGGKRKRIVVRMV